MNDRAEAQLFKLYNHPVFKEIKSIEDCRVFMEHHIYAVWDFMSLVKKVQSIFAPTRTPWMPSQHKKYRRFINEIIIAEESDKLEDGRVMSHCEMYLEAMREINASTKKFKGFLKIIRSKGLEHALSDKAIPKIAKNFMRHTFQITHSKKPHVIISSFSYGRENIIPGMFQKILDGNQLDQKLIPMFREYLNKHIELDGDHHGPMAKEMVKLACAENKIKLAEAEQAAMDSIQARITFWDGLLDVLLLKRKRVEELEIQK